MSKHIIMPALALILGLGTFPTQAQTVPDRFEIQDIEFSPDGSNILVAGTADTCGAATGHRILVLNTATREVTSQLTGHLCEVTSASWSPDGRHIASSSHDGSVRIWDVATGSQTAMLGNPTTSLESGSFYDTLWHPTRNQIAVLAGGPVVVDVSDMTVVDWINLDDAALSLQWNPTGTALALTTGDNRLQVWNMIDDEPLLVENTILNEMAFDLSWSPDASKIVTSNQQGVYIFDLATNQLMPLFSRKSDFNYFYIVEWSPDGTQIAVGDKMQVTIWDVASSSPIATFAYNGDIVEMDWSSDSRYLAYAGDTSDGNLLADFIRIVEVRMH